MMNDHKILFIGDVVGVPGRAMFQKHVARLVKEYSINTVIVNGENSASNGRGITPRHVAFFKHNGADVITTGNHIWASKSIYGYISEDNRLLRPINFPSGTPGVGMVTIDSQGHTIGVINVQGRVFMREQLSCPFRAVDSAIALLKRKSKTIVVDFHAETTAEKAGMGLYLDGQVSAVIGTHTHVQTADDRILPHGTAFITDVGMVGAYNSMIGMQKEEVLRGILTQMPTKFVVDERPPLVLCCVIITVNRLTGMPSDFQRIKVIDEELQISENIE